MHHQEIFPYQRTRPKNRAEELAFDIVARADEMIGHQKVVPEKELLSELYPKFEILMSEWTEKLDRINATHENPKWLIEFAAKRESQSGRPVISVDATNLGFKLENAFFGEKFEELTKDHFLISEPMTMWKEDFDKLSEFCDENGLEYYVDGFSRKRPLHTFRIAIFRPAREALKGSDVEFREQAIIALEKYNTLVKKKNGVGNIEIAKIEDSLLIEALVETGKFDKQSAWKMISLMQSAGLIPK